jgi:hypothetical protein
MLEVYTGSRPGHRSALLVVTALLLAGAIGLAGWQVHLALGLGPAVPIPGSPLLVRLPSHWKRDPHKPAAFFLPTRGAPRQQIADFERRITFQYDRTAGFRPPLELLTARSDISAAEPARIGPFAAVQVRQREPRRWGVGQSVLRVANLPNGDRVSMLYLPMSALTTADLKLLDTICKAVQFSDSALQVGWDQACRAAGIELARDPGWAAALPAVAEAPGLFIGGQLRGVPAWSLGIFRTWLAADRSPADLLGDFAAEYWLINKAKITRPDWKRADGAQVALVHYPDQARNRRPISAAVVVARSPAEALLLFVYSDQRFADAADQATERIACNVQFVPVAAVPDLEAAEQAGRDFAAELAAAGAVPWWGELPVKSRYVGETLRGQEVVSLAREALSRNPVRGYRGHRIVTVGRRYDEVTRWEAARTGRYDFQTEISVGDGQTLQVFETRSARGEPVTRVRRLNDAEYARKSFTPGAAFVSPPLESLAESWAARESQAALITEYSTLLGEGTHTCLLRPLAREKGCARVLVQQDFWPLGEVLGFDDTGELQFQRSAAGEYQRVVRQRS